MHPLQWLRGHDPNSAALRRAVRAAVIMPAMFAFGAKVLDNPTIATFAAFGSFAMLLLVDFGGSVRERAESQAALGATGAAFVALGTLASQRPWLAAVAMAVVGLAVLFAGVVSSVLAGAAPSLLLSFILPVATRAPLRDIPDRMAGWALAGAVSVVAVSLLWPAPRNDPMRAKAGTACRALATRLRSDAAYRRAHSDPDVLAAHNDAVIAADDAVTALHTAFLATPYRPTGLSTPARALVRLIDEINWLNAVVVKTAPKHPGVPIVEPALAVKTRAAAVLDAVADLLDRRTCDLANLTAAVDELRTGLVTMEAGATQVLPGARPDAPTDAVDVVSALDPSFRAQELSFAVGQIAANVERTVRAEQRTWIERVLGRQPDGLVGPWAAARERASAHLERHSVWLHNSARGGVALGAAIYIANVTGVQHSFWVVLGTLSVLRSNALSTGQNIVRGLLGTTLGVAVGAALLWGIGSDTTLLWVLLPIAVLVAGVAPAAISFTAGQAAFTATLLILYNIIAPTGWRVGLVRIEDIAIGGAVSIVVGLLFWPRGAAASLGLALAEAYADSAAYLDAAVRYGVSCCARDSGSGTAPTQAALTAAAASRRLDDTFRTYLGERGAKRVELAGVTALITGAASVRLAGDAVCELWQRDDAPPGDRDRARRELLDSAGSVHGWFDDFAAALTRVADVPAPIDHDGTAAARLAEAVRSDLVCDDAYASATAVRVIWTGDHLDAVRRLQPGLATRARAALDGRRIVAAGTPLTAARPHLHDHSAG